ncbi:2-phospho-L-lactate guanylyltransferase [Nocardia sp. NPDC057353]|uniref:2-phospho-L-lactate guanylyltransferase n=1 Tax=Nocardia sp. NPDC057353 TaxID=3346104 RepID=UPI00362B16EB
MRPHAVHAVIAVKSLDRAKSRLADLLRPEHRSRLVLAMLTDTVQTALATAPIDSVTVVTPDEAVAALARALGATAFPDPGGVGAGLAPDGLNTALTAAAEAVRRTHGPVGLVAMQADLPALRPAELAEAIAAAPPGRRAVVTDHTGEGTAALLQLDRFAPLAPRFGPSSALRHVTGGAFPLDGDWPGLRHDVDTGADLDRIFALGAGPATTAVLADIGRPSAVHEPARPVC